MPRVSHKILYQRHQHLHKLWQHDQRPFALLDPKKQAELHRYYQSTKYLTDRELRDHQQRVAQRDPSLPNRAGKIYAQLEQQMDEAKKLLPDVIRLPDNIVLPQSPPEIRRLARAMLAYARWQRDRERADD